MSKKKLYAIVDIETTGGRANRDKITEVAIVLFDGEKIVDRYDTLINPERSIPYNITQITGISQEMVEEAPKFYEVAKKIVEMTQGAIFVAHNVRFDYNFLREEFKRLGYTFTKRLLCTVRLSRQAFPGYPSYSLGNLIKYFNLEVERRHRALDDALATTEILQRILSKESNEEKVKDIINLGIKEANLPKNISLDQLHELPEECGVYYFYDESGDVIYVGKSINIKSRVMQHFNNKNRKGGKLHEAVHDISFDITGSELIALLKESHLIKKLHPRINRAQRQRSFLHVIHWYTNDKGYICMDITRATKAQKAKLNVAYAFPNVASAKGALHRIVQDYELCETFCKTDRTGSPCFYYHIHKCHGACIGEEEPESYNERVMQAVHTLGNDFGNDFVIIEEGRNREENAVVLIEDGQYQGFGFIDKSEPVEHIESLKEAIQPYQHNPDIVRIIRHYIHSTKSEMQLIKF